MSRPKIIIAESDTDYIVPLQLKFVHEFFEKIDLELITDRTYFDLFFSAPQSADVLIVSEDFYNADLHRHNIVHIFVMTERKDDERQSADRRAEQIFKYSSIKEIFNVILAKSSDVLRPQREEKRETQVIAVYSAAGGVGKTTVAIGMSACLAKIFKRVLYVNAACMHTFQFLLENQSPIAATDVYTSLRRGGDDAYRSLTHVIRKEGFSYIPPFRMPLMSVGLSYGIYEKIIAGAKRSGEYDFIMVDMDTVFDEERSKLLDLADRVILVTNQSKASVSAMNRLIANINNVRTEKYIFVCSDLDKTKANALISPDTGGAFSIHHYIDHFEHYETRKAEDFASDTSMRNLAYLVI